MTHRAQQIVERIQSLLQASSNLGVNSQNVFAMRSLTLSDEQGELPAITIEYDDDQPVPTSQYGSIWSALGIVIAIYDREEDEQSLHTALLNIRAQVEFLLSRDIALGLSSFVLLTKYEGVSAPELDSSGDKIIGKLEIRFRVTYAMDRSDTNA